MTSAEGEAPRRRGEITGLRGVELVRHGSRSPLFSSTQDWGDEAGGVNVISLPEDVNFVWPYPHAFPQESPFGTFQPMNRYSCGEGRPAGGLLQDGAGPPVRATFRLPWNRAAGRGRVTVSVVRCGSPATALTRGVDISLGRQGPGCSVSAVGARPEREWALLVTRHRLGSVCGARLPCPPCEPLTLLSFRVLPLFLARPLPPAHQGKWRPLMVSNGRP